MLQPVVTDLAGRVRALLSESEVELVAKLNGYASVQVDLEPSDRGAAELLVAERAIRVYEDDELWFNGQVWEPLTKTAERVIATARDPFAALAWRRVRERTVYTAIDAAAIAYARLAAQNGHRNTYLAAGTSAASVNRDRTYDPGKREDEIVEQLAEVQDGFYFKVRPVDGDENVLGALDILYPDSGVVREEVRFEYGEETLDNLTGYDVSLSLPLNRVTATTADDTGGRIASVAKNDESIGQFGLFEDEFSVLDVSVLATLDEHARAEIRPTPPMVVACTPGAGAPLLIRDFDVGDIVRLRINDASVDVLVWVRVLEAAVRAGKDGPARLSKLVVESVAGGRLADLPHPAERLKLILAAQEARLAAAERRIQIIAAGTSAPAAAPVGDEQDAPTPPAEPGGGGAAGPTAPPPAPEAAMTGAFAFWLLGSSPSVHLDGNANPKGSDTVAWFEIQGGASTPEQAVGAGVSAVPISAEVSGLLSSTTYQARVVARSAAGTTASDWLQFTTPGSPGGPA